jgi:hypothetical protein
MQRSAHYRQRVVTDADVAFIRELIAEHPRASRRELSYLLCGAWNWVQANGALRDMVCRGLMLKLHREGRIELPPVRRRPPNPLVERKKPAAVEVDTRPLRDRLAEIRPLEFRSVRRTPEEPLFNSLLEQYHYLRQTACRGTPEISGLRRRAAGGLFCVVLVGTLPGLPGPLSRLVGAGAA